jgi:hypothetical protein
MTIIDVPARASSNTSRRLVDNPVLAWILLAAGFLVLLILAFRGWIPHDEGTLGQAAIRVMGGEVPHVDFHDTYGGLQAYVHGGIFSVIGESVRSLRTANIAVAAMAALASFTIVRRVQPVVVAASAGVAALLVGFAVYPASMPSWWNAAMALVAVALVLRWSDSGNTALLAGAGVVTGLSFLVKSTGAYIAAAIALYLIILMSRGSPRRPLLIAIGATVVAAFGLLLAASPSLQSFVGLLIPMAAITSVGFRSGVRAGHLGDRVVPFLSVVVFCLAVLAPVALYVLPYVLSGNGDALVGGWFRLPQLRFDEAVWTMSFPASPVFFLAAAVLLFFVVRRRMGAQPAFVALIALEVSIAVVAWKGWWVILVLLTIGAPLLVAIGVVRGGWGRKLSPEQLLSALTLSAFAFIQFPMSNAIYAIYLVPLIVTAIGVWLVGENHSRAIAAVFLIASAIVSVQLGRGLLYLASPVDRPVEMATLEVERGGIDIPAQQAFYTEMVDHLGPYEGTRIYAGPDSPEIYFLTGTSNPTPVLFDFLAEEWSISELEDPLRKGELSAVVLNRSPDFSSQVPIAMVELIEAEFPVKTTFGPFEVYEDRPRQAEVDK